jgi:multidrug efflux pump subunit AcrA (membrane-fusion protein)
MYVNSVVPVADRNNALAIPQTAVLKGPDGAENCFVIEAGKLVKRRVETGVSVDDLVEIASGLHGEEEVVKSAVSTLIDGSPAASIPTPQAAR